MKSILFALLFTVAGCAAVKAGLDAVWTKAPAAAKELAASPTWLKLVEVAGGLLVTFAGGALSYHGVQTARGKVWVDKNADGLVDEGELVGE